MKSKITESDIDSSEDLSSPVHFLIQDLVFRTLCTLNVLSTLKNYFFSY